jgi:hypothetical protein
MGKELVELYNWLDFSFVGSRKRKSVRCEDVVPYQNSGDF